MAERFNSDRPAADKKYDTPLRKRLEYGTPLHQQILSRLVQRRQLSERHISARYEDWSRVDEHIQQYINLSRRARRPDKTELPNKREMPFDRAIVIPASYATLMVRLTTLMSIFLARSPIVQVKGRGPEDVAASKIMEGIMAYDLERMRVELVLYAAMQDAEKYGIGVIQDSWDVEPGWKVEATPNIPGIPDQIQAALRKELGIPEVNRRWGTVSEGNIWRAIDPYLFWPDPRIPGQRLQEGEFCGHRTRRSYMYLMERSDTINGPNSMYFNIKHIRKGREANPRDVTNRRDSTTNRDLAQIDFRDTTDEKDRGVFNIDTIQVKLIPDEWGLGAEKRPEIWWFAMADDNVVIRAQRSEHNHNQFTYATMTPNYDAHTVFQQGSVEIMDGLQRVINWLYNSHLENVRRHLNDAVLYSPKFVEETDLLNPGPARHVRLTPAAEQLIQQGTHTAQSFWHQLGHFDVTQSHLNQVDNLFELVHRMLGTNDPVSGQTTSTKRTLGEVERIIAASGRRMNLTAQLYDSMAVQPLAMRAILNRQQFTEIEEYIEITGELAREQGMERLLVNREQLQGSYNYMPISGIVPPDPARFADIWMNILTGAGQIPQLQEPGPDGKVVDFRAIFKEAAQAMGARNIEEFFTQIAPVAPEVAPDETVQQEVQAGNLVPASEAEFQGNGSIAGAGL